jgi:hypothetical protein
MLSTGNKPFMQKIGSSSCFPSITTIKEVLAMSDFFFDEERAVAYKINPLVTSIVQHKDTKEPQAILVQTNVKVTNFKKEKVRRILSEVYPIEKYDTEAAEKKFYDTLILKLVGNATKISAEEYEAIKAKVENI